MRSPRIQCAFAALALAVASSAAAAPVDNRLRERVNLRTSYFPFEPPETLEAWERRAAQVRRQIAVAAGHWPEPARPEPNATVHGAVDRETYTVSRVFLETLPGHFATGSLYRPKSGGRHPAVISPYGHWPGGRFQDIGAEGVARQIAEGAEKFEVGGRHAIQARCVQLARMGCVVFLIDCIGYGDSQLSQESIHAPTEETVIQGDDAWGFYSVQAELRLQNPLGVQLYDARCALDWLATLPDVDPDRLAVTGASGGATQTMMLCATDDRLKVAFPAAMVSTAMQGGCPCENACCLRIGTGNVEIAALFAPKPLGMGSANDWTHEMPTKGFPELQQLYALYGKRDHVSLTSLNQFGHNYNYPTRAAMYVWMKKWLELDADVDPIERDFVPLTRDELTVWNDAHPKPLSGREHEVALLQEWYKKQRAAMASVLPKSEGGLSEFRQVVGSGVETILGHPNPDRHAIALRSSEEVTLNGVRLQSCSVSVPETGALLSAILHKPATPPTGVVVWTSPGGRAGVFDDGALRPEGRELLSQGYAVLTAPLLYEYRLVTGHTPLNELPTNVPDRDSAGLTYGYNRTLVAERAADLLTLIAAAEELLPDTKVMLLAERGAAPYAAAAFALSGDRLAGAAIDTGGFRFERLTSWRDLDFLPGAVKYGDLPGFLALGAPTPLLLAGEQPGDVPLTSVAYSASDAAGALSHATANSLVEAAARFFDDLQ